MPDGKRILIILGGGIAAYKLLDTIRGLRRKGAHIRVIMTKAAKQFVTPLSVASLSGEKVFDDMFDLTDETEIGHIQLSRDADVILVAPATADLMAKMAGGHCDDLATTCLLATDKPVIIAPAMNVRMWEHPATQANLKTLKERGVAVIGPDEGEMACGEFGPGRLAEPDAIIAGIAAHFGGEPLGIAGHGGGPLAGKKVMITAGPTYEPIDPVRYIANRSSGKQGYAIARAAMALGAQVSLVSGPVHLDVPDGVEVIPVETAREMMAAARGELPADIGIFTAAVADWRTVAPANQKMKKTAKSKTPNLELTENPDILATIAQLDEDRPRLVIGFAAETENVLANAKAKLKRKGCDWIVANDVSKGTGVMGGSRNTVHIVTEGGAEDWPEMSKDDVARKLMDAIAAHVNASA